MFKNKNQVDLHVQNLFKRCKNENERNSRSYHIAKLYKQVGDYESARRFISRFLTTREDSAEAHNLYGQILLGLKEKKKALAEFKCSLELDHHQHDLLLKVCNLLAELDEPLDLDRAQYWVDRTRTHYPNNSAVFRLCERMVVERANRDDVSSSSKGNEELEALLAAELAVRPSDVSLRVRLLQLYLRSNRVKDAYKHAALIEAKGAFRDDLRWYECLIEVFEAYKEVNKDWEYMAGYLNVLERLCALSLEEYPIVDSGITRRSNVDCAKVLQNFDEALHSASQIDVVSSEREFFHEFLKHMRGQLVLHMATLIFRKAKKDTTSWREESKAAATLLSLAVGIGGYALPDPQPPWALRLSEKCRKEVARWAVETSFRVSQAGHILMGLCRDRGLHFLHQVGQFCVGNWRERVYQRAVGSKSNKEMDNSSHFLNFQGFSRPFLELPSVSDLQPHDEVAQKLNPGSLHHVVWLGIESGHCAASGGKRSFEIPPEFCCVTFDGLSLSNNNLKSGGGPESLSQLDVDAFLYATVYCSASLQDEWNKGLSSASDQQPPSCFPAALTDPLCTPSQSHWWSAAHKLLIGNLFSKGDHKEIGDVGERRLTLQRGLEVIRTVGNHGLGPELCVKLARAFTKRAKMLSLSSATSSNEVHALEERANLYWSAALPILERLSRNQAVQYPQKRLFEYRGKPLTNSEITSLLDEAHLAMAVKMMTEGKDEEAIAAFQLLKAPEASYNQALIYKKLAAQENNSLHREDITPEMKSRQVALLTKCKECLHLTKERLRMADADKSHPISVLVGNEMEELEMQLDRLNVSSWIDPQNMDNLSILKDDPVEESRNERAWYLQRDWNVGTRNGTSSASVLHSTPVRTTPNRWANGASNANVVGTLKENHQNPIHSNENIHLLLDSQSKIMDSQTRLIEEIALLKRGMDSQSKLLEGIDYLKRGMDSQSRLLDEIEVLKRGVEFLKRGMEELKEQGIALKEDVAKLKSSRHQLHHPSEGTRQTAEGRDAEEDIYVYGDEDEYGDGEDVNIAAAAAAASAAAAAAAAAVAASTQADKYGTYPAAGYPYQGYPAYRQMSGVQGAATVTYGAPTAPSQGPPPPPTLLPPAIAPFFPLPGAPVDPSLLPSNAAGMYHSSLRYYSQGALPFSEGQQLPDFRGDARGLSGAPLRPPMLPPGMSTHPEADRGTPPFHSLGNEAAYMMDKHQPAALPVNVVITSSDTLPTSVPPNQPQLSVVIPPRHRLGTPATPTQPIKPAMDNMMGSVTSAAVTSTITTAPHAFQISMPPQAQIPTGPPLDKNVSSVPPLETDKLLSSVPSPVHSAVAIDKNTPKSSRPSSSPKARLSRKSLGEDDDDGAEEGDSIEHDPYPDFQPVIPLPAVVETHTGEEEETLLFSSRAKLYRFVDKEWKERGIGVIKILHNQTTGKARIIMRREQVLKVCANHFITPDMVLSPIASSKGLAWLWCANDFADEEVRLEKLSARFKTSVEAEGFRDAFEKAKEISAEAKADLSSSEDEKGEKDSQPTVIDSQKIAPPAKELPKTPKSVADTSNLVTTSESSKVVLGGFTFVSPPTLKPVDRDDKSSSKKKMEEKKTTTKPSIFADFTFGQSSSPSTGGITWGKPALGLSSVTTDSSTKDVAKPVSSVDQKDKTPVSKVSFSMLVSDSEKKETSAFKSDNNTKGLETTPKTTFGSSSPSGAREGEGDGEEGDFMPTVEFKPVIPLPQLVEVKTGEEGEDVLFEQRAKLLRYGNKEWIEFGIGQMKITFNPSTGKVRLIMRREQVLKVCCNHFLTEDMQFMPLKTSDRCWTWHAQDYADGTLTAKTLAIKFKAAEEAMKFKNVLDDLQKNMVDGKAKLDKMVSSKDGNKETQKDDTTGGCKVNVQTLSDMFKPETGSWECKECYIRNKEDTKTCMACKTLRPGFQEDSSTKEGPEKSSFSPFKFGVGPQVTASPQVQAPTPTYTFGIQPTSTPAPSASFKFSSSSTDTPKTTASFGTPIETPKSSAPQTKKVEGLPSLASSFKPEEGSWECKSCYVRNKKDIIKCSACSSLKPGAVSSSEVSSSQPSSQTSFVFGIKPPLADSQKTPVFGIKTDPSKTTTVVSKPTEGLSSLAASFKPEEGSWECKSCYIRNKKDIINCEACGTLKPGEVAVPSTTISQPSTQPAFRFGIQPESTTEPKAAAPTTAFTFGTASVVSSVAKPAADVWAPTKFVFSGSQQSASGTTFSSPAPVFGQSPASFTFGAGLTGAQASESPNTGFTFASNQKYEFNFKGIEPKNSNLATSPSGKGSFLKSPDRQISHDESGGSDLYQEDDEGDHIHFQPVIPLPDKVPVHTGEEDEEILYQHRSKLYRWNNGEWKERGCGDIKLLKHKETGRVRMIMRREQVLKLCLNHYVTEEITLSAKGDRAWQWTAVDFSEGEVHPELFSLRFKSSEIALAFKDAFEDAKAGLNKSVTENEDSVVKTPVITATPTNTPVSGFPINKSPAMQSFSFKLDSERTSTSPSPSARFSLEGLFGGKSPKIPTDTKKSPEIEVVYEFKTSDEDRLAAIRLMLPPNFYAYRDLPPCPGCRGCADEAEQDKIFSQVVEDKPKDAVKLSSTEVTCEVETTNVSTAESTMSKSEPKVTDGKSSNGKPEDYDLPFFKLEPGLTFASLAASDSPSATFSSPKPIQSSWGNVNAPVFSSSQTSSAKKAHGGESEGEDDDGGTVESNDPHFEPIIPLPALIKVSTGEEEETKVFGERAKLYRYDADAKEWKERGVGELKILYHPVNHTYRFLMRRELVHKLVCNHLVTADFDLKEMKTSDKSYVWCATNYAEETPSLEQLCARFKNVDLAKKFAEATRVCVADIIAYQASKSIQSISVQESDVSQTSLQQEDEEHVDDEDDDEYEEVEDDEIERKAIFDKRGKMEVKEKDEWRDVGVGDIKVIYEPELCGTMITLETADGLIKCSAVISSRCSIKVKDKYCDFTAEDLTCEVSVFRKYRVQFSSEHAASEFEAAFKQGVSIAL